MLPYVSIIIATYNSSKILDKTLNALAHQTYPTDQLEIIIIDGGSTDNTREIASSYNCRVIDNPKKDPVSAKAIGYKASHGKYVMTLDHDEVLINPNSIRHRIDGMVNHPECKAAFCSGYKRPDDYPGLNQYISEYGDPLSLFVYHCSKDYKRARKTYLKSGKLVNPLNESSSVSDTLYDVIEIISPKKIIVELCCMATIIDKEFFEATTSFMNDPAEMVHLYYNMLETGHNRIIVSKNDPLEHYSADSLVSYLPKLRWRVINNVHFAERANQGFKGRPKSYKTLFMTYLFPLYSITFIFPLIEAIFLALSRRNSAYLLHPFLCIYVTIYIIWQYIRKILRVPPVQRTYDGKDIE